LEDDFSWLVRAGIPCSVEKIDNLNRHIHQTLTEQHNLF